LPVLFQYSCEILHIGKAAKTIIRNMYTQFDFVISVRKCTRYDELSFIKLKWFIQESSLILLNTCKGSQSLIYYGIDVNLFWTFSVGPLIFIQPKFSIFTTYKKLHVGTQMTGDCSIYIHSYSFYENNSQTNTAPLLKKNSVIWQFNVNTAYIYYMYKLSYIIITYNIREWK